MLADMVWKTKFYLLENGTIHNWEANHLIDLESFNIIIGKRLGDKVLIKIWKKKITLHMYLEDLSFLAFHTKN